MGTVRSSTPGYQRVISRVYNKMAAGGFDDMEMEDRDECEREMKEGGEEETSFGGYREREEWQETPSGRFTHVDVGGDVPDSRHDGRAINASITRDRKEFLSRNLGLDVRLADGKNSRKLIREMIVTFGVRGEPNGVEYKGVKVVVSRNEGKTFELSKNKKSSGGVSEFKRLMEKAREERNETSIGQGRYRT